MYLIDTNVLSDGRVHSRAHHGVIQFFDTHPAKQQFVSAITLYELQIGQARLARRDKRQANMLGHWIEEIERRFSGRTLAIDGAIARRAALMHVPNPRPERDAFIGATAIHHDLTVVTRNIADFEPMGVKVFNPWAP
jgi:toxin FitB